MLKKYTLILFFIGCASWAFAGISGRKGIADDQLLAFALGLIGLLLIIGYSREIIYFLKKQLSKQSH